STVRMAGDHFEFADKTPVKFWGVNLSYGGGCAPKKADAEFTAARYAGYGVNCVRLHKFSYPKDKMGIGDLKDWNGWTISPLNSKVMASITDGRTPMVSMSARPTAPACSPMTRLPAT
ncbi:MAG: hypothetical protein NTW03_07930, partial [Verrucomicrobia bacterium]|nr:hypothetical protein [Verrucomicrobiota bacterium]